MDKLITQLSTKPFTDSDISKFTNCNIFLYEELKDFTDIHDVLGKHNCAVILYQIEKDYGHWVTLNKIHNNLEFFDSYGYKPDDEFRFARYNRTHNDKYLTKLLLDSGLKVIYNPYQLQSKGKKMSSCGRWCVLRLNMRTIPVLSFSKLFIGQKNKPDWYVTALTMFIT